MTSRINIVDLVQVNASDSLVNLSKSDKHKLIDSAMSGDKAPKGLKINFNLSHSGKKINSRVYTPKGHIAGIESWTTPFAKPILVHHDQAKDPIGRITQVSWLSLEDKAMKYFASSKAYSDFLQALDSGDARKVYQAFKKNNLLFNKKFPGVGVLKASASITDSEAIQKFLDKRYLTFSAGMTSNALNCGICNANWASGDFCDHPRGSITDKGDLVIQVPGDMEGDEASVVNGPADNEGYLTSMQFSDSIEINSRVPVENKDYSENEFFMSDSEHILGDIMETENLEKVEVPAEVQKEAEVPAVVEDAKPEVAQESVKEEVVAPEPKDEIVVQDFSIEIDLLDLALDAELIKDKNLTSGLLQDSDKEKLDDTSFFKNRKIVLNDSTHVVALKRILDKVKVSDKLKSELDSFLMKKETLIKDSELRMLIEDYKKALEDIKLLKDEVSELKDKLEKEQEKPTEREVPKEKAIVENPSVDSSDLQSDAFSSKKEPVLEKFEQNILNKYNTLLKDHGQKHADYFLLTKKMKGQLRKDFDPKTIMES